MRGSVRVLGAIQQTLGGRERGALRRVRVVALHITQLVRFELADGLGVELRLRRRFTDEERGPIRIWPE